jgi:hypothetical protein
MPSQVEGKTEVQSDKFRDYILEQYKSYVEMADRISQRRALANSFFSLYIGVNS